MERGYSWLCPELPGMPEYCTVMRRSGGSGETRKIEWSGGIHPNFSGPRLCDIPWSGWTGTVLSVIVSVRIFPIKSKEITLKDPRLFPMFAWVRDLYAFSVKIIVFRYNTGILTNLSLNYDDYRRPRRGAPAADWWIKNTKKTSLPRRASERPWGGYPSYSGDFFWFQCERYRFMSISCENISIQIWYGTHSQKVTMNAAALTRRPRSGWENYQKNSFPLVPQRGPESGAFRIKRDFHGSDVNRIDSCLSI